MTRDEAYAACPDGSYVEFYGGRWVIIPYAEVIQPPFFNCQPNTLTERSAA